MAMRKFVVVLETASEDDSQFINYDITQELRCCTTFWERISVREVKSDTAVMASKLRFMAELLGDSNGKTDDDKDEG